MGRVHASEAPSSFIMQGLVDFLISSHSVAEELRKYLIFKLVPMMNPDGVFLGNTKGNLLGIHTRTLGQSQQISKFSKFSRVFNLNLDKCN